MIEVTKWPVIIYANYRTGSTALGFSLAKQLGCKYYNEPFYKPEVHEEFMKETGTDYIIKFMGDHVDENPMYVDLLSRDSFKIRLYRENKVEQIASYYVSKMTERWRTTAYDNINDYNLHIDLPMLKESFRRILYNDHLLDTAPVKFDITYTYEELGFIEDTHLILTKQPGNINAIKKLIENLMYSKFTEGLHYK